MGSGVFRFIGTVVGYAIGGPIGGMIGGFLGGLVDNAVFKPPAQEGPRLNDLNVPGVNPGTPITWLYGTVRVPATMIWTTGLEETAHEEEAGGGSGKGAPSGPALITYTYSASIAFGICEGPVYKIRRIWGDTKIIYEDQGYAESEDKPEERRGQRIATEEETTTDGTVIMETASDSNKRFAALRMYYGTEDQMPDPTIEAAEGVGEVPAHRGLCYIVFEDLQLADFGNRIPTIQVEVQRGPNPTDTLTYIVTDLCQRSGLTPDEYVIECSFADKPVRGMPVTRATPARTLFEKLQVLHNFDAVETGYKLKFSGRNKRTNAFVLKDDIAATANMNDIPPEEEWSRLQEYDLPKELVLRFIDIDRDLTPSAVRTRRIITESQVVTEVEMPIVMNASEAKTACDELSSRMYIERTTIQWKLPLKYILMDVGDIVQTIDPETREVGALQYRIVSVTLGANGIIEWQLIPHEFQLTIPQATGDTRAPIGTYVPFVGETIPGLIDGPMLRDNDVDDYGFYVSLGSAGLDWGGGILMRDPDGSAAFASIFTTQKNALIGVTHSALPDSDCLFIDRTSTLTVEIQTAGTFSDITEEQLFAANNAIALQNADGAWEILKFQNATRLSDNTWELDTFIRGRRGTEFAARNHQSGAKFVLLQISKVAYQSQETQYANVELDYKAVTASMMTTTAQTFQFTNTNARLKPLSVADLGELSERVGNNWVLDWRRRARKLGGWNNMIDVPLDEPTETYSIDVFTDATFTTVVNTYGVSGASTFTYTQAMQVADFGSVQSTIYVKVYQVSARVGRGYEARETLVA